MSEVKPREFWIDDEPEGDDGYIQVFQALSRHPRQGPLLWQESLIHVIEKSAFDALKEENEKLRKVLKAIVSLDSDPFNHHKEASKCAICMAREALKEKE